MCILLLSAQVAAAARAPTLAEREAITRALPVSLRNTPTECVWLNTRVSKNPRYALVKPVYLNATKRGARCSRYASDGFYILKKSRTWKIVYEGSDPPSCALGIPQDLIQKCLGRRI